MASFESSGTNTHPRGFRGPRHHSGDEARVSQGGRSAEGRLCQVNWKKTPWRAGAYARVTVDLPDGSVSVFVAEHGCITVTPHRVS